MTDYSWLEPIERRTREVEAETQRLRRETMRKLPDKDRLRIMWQVAVTSAIEGQGESYEIFANLLHNYLTGKFDHITLSDK